MLRKVRMEHAEPCKWYLIKYGEEFGVQYDGHEPEKEFNIDLTGTLLNPISF